ncbi:hypothetical protein CP532_2373 [Ophiocordyceps camponoti-leonardi (nom. inval.)]|nr:hypothetical protein CP532_2373 [Ophiocordyceps camponoti-leonardi (nom. inval.)]
MESSGVSSQTRSFQPVLVGPCHAQTASDRFGKGVGEVIRDREQSLATDGDNINDASYDWSQSESDTGEDDVSIYKLVPTMQRFRNNLTALSQLYNLYMVAYQDRIFVYVPRAVPTQRVPRHPDLRLFPPKSNVSRHIGGYLDPDHPHIINHMIVGSLGNEELVVTSHDDGDVVAYSTRRIAEWIAGRSRRRRAESAGPPVQTLVQDDCPWHGPGSCNRSSIPKPFFHDNVGRSAWGLAIHERSRLIAVSCNHGDVTVFAPALTSVVEGRRRPEHEWHDECSDTCSECSGACNKCSKACSNCSGTCNDCSGTCINVESHVRQRARNWRILVSLGDAADNIPNVCFIDDAQTGSASMVGAVDIKGAVWLADIWKPLVPATRIPDGRHSARLGWGILVLPETSFLRVDTLRQLFGANGCEPIKRYHKKLNIRTTLRHVADNPCEGVGYHIGSPNSGWFIPPTPPGNWPLERDSESDSSEVEDMAEEEEEEEEDNEAEDGEEEADEEEAEEEEDEGPNTMTTWPGMAYYPHLGKTTKIPQEKDKLLSMLRRELPSLLNKTDVVEEREKLLEQHYMFRFFQEDVDLSRVTSKSGKMAPEVETVCSEVMKLTKRLLSPTGRRLFMGMDRISMVAHVPELWLVVAASATGRVVLLTPTRLGRKIEYEGMPLKVAFRVEWILPRRSDEMRTWREPRPLHGMAVGPVQVSSVEAAAAGAAAGASRPRRFRLMLHYSNHDILTYEVTRVEETGKVCIF